jgi:hypothetical protein
MYFSAIGNDGKLSGSLIISYYQNLYGEVLGSAGLLVGGLMVNQAGRLSGVAGSVCKICVWGAAIGSAQLNVGNDKLFKG